PMLCFMTRTFHIRSSLLFYTYSSVHRLPLHSFPTRRSSDLSPRYTPPPDPQGSRTRYQERAATRPASRARNDGRGQGVRQQFTIDRKSTRLNSSHVKISYAVFCLKKKKQLIRNT